MPERIFSREMVEVEKRTERSRRPFFESGLVEIKLLRDALESEIMKKMLVLGVLLVLLPVMNPRMPEFNGFILRHIKEQQKFHQWDFKDGVLSFFGPVLIGQMSERKSYFFFSVYTLSLPNKAPRKFLGILHLFIPV